MPSTSKKGAALSVKISFRVTPAVYERVHEALDRVYEDHSKRFTVAELLRHLLSSWSDSVLNDEPKAGYAADDSAAQETRG